MEVLAILSAMPLKAILFIADIIVAALLLFLVTNCLVWDWMNSAVHIIAD